MNKDFVFTQTKETIMTPDKTVTAITEKLETVDMFGKRTLCGYTHSKSVDFHNDDSSPGKRSSGEISGCICRFCKCAANRVCCGERRTA